MPKDVLSDDLRSKIDEVGVFMSSTRKQLQQAIGAAFSPAIGQERADMLASCVTEFSPHVQAFSAIEPTSSDTVAAAVLKRLLGSAVENVALASELLSIDGSNFEPVRAPSSEFVFGLVRHLAQTSLRSTELQAKQAAYYLAIFRPIADRFAQICFIPRAHSAKRLSSELRSFLGAACHLLPRSRAVLFGDSLAHPSIPPPLSASKSAIDWPASLLTGMSFDISRPPFSSADELLRLISSDQLVAGELNWESIVVPCRNVIVVLDLPVFSWIVEMPISSESQLGFSSIDLLWQLHRSLYGHLKDIDHHYLEGLMLLDGTRSDVPRYEIVLGS